MTRQGLRRALGAAPVLLAGGYAVSLTLSGGSGLSFGLGALAWILLTAGVILGGRSMIALSLYGFGAVTLAGLLVTPEGNKDVPPALLFFAWLVFALAWGSALPLAGSEVVGARPEIVSEGHQPLHRTGRPIGALVAVAIVGPVVALLGVPETGSAPQRLFVRAALTFLGVLVLALAGEVAGRAIELKPRAGHPRRLGKFLVGGVLWFVSTAALVGVTERLSQGAFGGALVAAVVSGVGAFLGLRSLGSAREN